MIMLLGWIVKSLAKGVAAAVVAAAVLYIWLELDTLLASLASSLSAMVAALDIPAPVETAMAMLNRIFPLSEMLFIVALYWGVLVSAAIIRALLALLGAVK